MEFCFNNNLIVYCKKNSCEIFLVKLVEDWKLILDNKYVVGILLIDLLKVFDLFYLLLLLVKLWVYGFLESVIDMMRCYFIERKNRVWMRLGGYSEWREVSRGCL